MAAAVSDALRVATSSSSCSALSPPCTFPTFHLAQSSERHFARWRRHRQKQSRRTRRHWSSSRSSKASQDWRPPTVARIRPGARGCISSIALRLAFVRSMMPAQLLLPLLVAERGGGAHRRAAGAAFSRASFGCSRSGLGGAQRFRRRCAASDCKCQFGAGWARTRPAGEPVLYRRRPPGVRPGVLPLGPRAFRLQTRTICAPDFRLDEARRASRSRRACPPLASNHQLAGARCPSLRNAAQCRAD